VTRFADHVSVYLLSVEPGTELHHMVLAGAVDLPCEARVTDLFACAGDLLACAGFHRYEISNWCRKGSECLHNMLYWSRGEYLGLGSGAHSHRCGRRYAKVSDPEAYVRSIQCGGNAVRMTEDLSPLQMFMEEVMLGLRTDRGIDPVAASTRIGVDPVPLTNLIRGLCEEGYASRDGNRIRLSAKGMMLHDAIAVDLVAAAGPAFPRSPASTVRARLQ
jgi:coproporphyrinogen III oxidase-like Fe-S oxidoreductase